MIVLPPVTPPAGQRAAAATSAGNNLGEVLLRDHDELPADAATGKRDGLGTFMGAGCITCHNGSTVGGRSFQKIGVINPYPGPDPGRMAVTGNEAETLLDRVLTSEVSTLAPGHGQPSALLTHRGKVVGVLVGSGGWHGGGGGREGRGGEADSVCQMSLLRCGLTQMTTTPVAVECI